MITCPLGAYDATMLHAACTSQTTPEKANPSSKVLRLLIVICTVQYARAAQNLPQEDRRDATTKLQPGTSTDRDIEEIAGRHDWGGNVIWEAEEKVVGHLHSVPRCRRFTVNGNQIVTFV